MKHRTFSSRQWGLIAVIAIGAVVLVAVSVALFTRPALSADESRFLTLLQQSEGQSNGVYDVSQGEAKATLTLKDGDYGARIELPDSNFEVLIKNATIYLKTSSFDTLQRSVGGGDNATQQSERMKNAFADFSNRWIEADLAMIRSQSPDVSRVYCGFALVEQLASKDASQWQELKNQYSARPFLDVRSISAPDGQEAFAVSTAPETFPAFAKSYEESAAYKSIKRCDGVDLMSAAMPAKSEIKVTFDTQKNELASVVFGQREDTTTPTVRIAPSNAEPQSLATPKDTLTYQEFVQRISAAASAR